jgi:hypothetical protein
MASYKKAETDEQRFHGFFLSPGKILAANTSSRLRTVVLLYFEASKSTQTFSPRAFFFPFFLFFSFFFPQRYHFRKFRLYYYVIQADSIVVTFCCSSARVMYCAALLSRQVRVSTPALPGLSRSHKRRQGRLRREAKPNRPSCFPLPKTEPN